MRLSENPCLTAELPWPVQHLPRSRTKVLPALYGEDAIHYYVALTLR